MNNENMTSFQIVCLHDLTTALAKRKVSFDDIRKTKGRAETFIEGRIGNTHFWIYEDMADMKTGKSSKIFERPDYKTEQELIDAFVNAISETCSPSKG